MFRQLTWRLRERIYGANIVHHSIKDNNNAQSSALGFENLVDEMQLEIFSKLDLKDLLTIPSVSKHFNNLSNDNNLWKILFKQYFPDDYKKLAEQQNVYWKKEFKKKFDFFYYGFDLRNVGNNSEKEKITRKKTIIKISKLILLKDIKRLKALDIQYVDLMIANQFHYSLLTLVAKTGDQAMRDYFYRIAETQFLHQNHPDKVDPLKKDINHFTILHLAIICNQPILFIEMLLKTNPLLGSQCDLNAVTNDNITPLYFAAQYGHVDIVRVLLAHGADVNIKTKTGMTPLHVAVRNGHYKVLQLLLAHGADTNTSHLRVRATPLHTAVQNSDLRMVKLLLTEKNIDVNALQTDGMAPLHIAAQNGDDEIVEGLLSYMKSDAVRKADINISLPDGTTPLYIAAQNGHVKIVNLMASIHNRKKQLVDINKCDHSGASPLFIAAQNGHVEIVKILLSTYGIDINAACHDGMTPLKISEKNGHQAIVKIINEHIVAQLTDFIASQKIIITHHHSENPNTLFSPKETLKAAKTLRRVIFKGADESALEKHKEVIAGSELKNLYWGFRR